MEELTEYEKRAIEDWIDLEKYSRFCSDPEEVALFDEIGDMIIEKDASTDQIVDLLRDVNSYLAHDVIKVLFLKKFITYEESKMIDQNLIDIYEKEFVDDLQTGVLLDRIKGKVNKNKRLICQYEICGVYFRHSLDYKPLYFEEKAESEFADNLAKIHRKISEIRISNILFRKREEEKNQLKTNIQNKLDALSAMNC